MENLARGSSQIIRDEDFARKLQSEELLTGRDSYISLTTQLNEYKLDSLKKYRRNAATSYELKENDDSVIVIDDDSDDLVPVRLAAANSFENPNRIRRSRTLHLSPSYEALNKKQKEIEERMKADERLARRMQNEYDNELLASRSTQRLIEREIDPLQSRQDSNHHTSSSLRSSIQSTSNLEQFNNPRQHSDSLQNAYTLLQQRRNRNFGDIAFHPSIEQDMFNLVTRNISSNELRVDRSPTPTRRVATERRNPDISSHNQHRLHHQFNVNININSNPIYNPREPVNIRRDMQPRFGTGGFLDPQFNNNRRSFHEYISENQNVSGNSYERLLQLDERIVKSKVSKQELESLNSFAFKTIKDNVCESDMSCAICFDDYDSKSNLTALVCSHKFHSNCIKKWLNQSRRCPLCQKDAINGT